MQKNGFLLYSKLSGVTSFTSLSVIKKTLQTTKIGHTGTLDLFADGLLVVMVNKLTKLVGQVTDFDKKYDAIIYFGKQTDTLDPEGEVIENAPLPNKEDFLHTVSDFIGVQEQIPPEYSAIHVNGKRASDIMRQGKMPVLAPRSITIFALDVVEFADEFAHIRVHCSKGTYIRSLVRDLAHACKSCGHLIALRRTAVGPFQLENAVGFELLPQFSIKNIHALREKKILVSNEYVQEKIVSKLQDFTPEFAILCRFAILFLRESCENDFFHGAPMCESFFTKLPPEYEHDFLVFRENTHQLCGSIKKTYATFSYNFVIS